MLALLHSHGRLAAAAPAGRWGNGASLAGINIHPEDVIALLSEISRDPGPPVGYDVATPPVERVIPCRVYRPGALELSRGMNVVAMGGYSKLHIFGRPAQTPSNGN